MSPQNKFEIKSPIMNSNKYELTAIFTNDYQEELLIFSLPEYAHFIKRKLVNIFEP